MDQFCAVLLSISINYLALINLVSVKFNTKEKISILIITDLISYLVYCLSQSLLAITATIVMIFFMYKKTKKIMTSIGMSILANIIVAIADIIVYFLKVLFSSTGSYIDKSNISYFFMCVIIAIITFIISKLLGALINKRIHMSIEDIKGKSAVLMIFSLILTFVIIFSNIIIGKHKGFTNESVRKNFVLFTMCFVFLMIILFVLISNIRKEIRFESAKQEIKNLQEYTSNLETLYNDMRVFRHDYINILSSMVGYIENKDMEGLEKHFNKNIIPLSEGMKSNNFKIGLLQNIKIPEIKGIISSKVIRAQEVGIDVSIEVMEPIEKISMDIIDLSRAVGILLDNAVEAAQKCDKPYIKLGIICKEKSVIIVILNSIPEDTPPIYKIYKKGFSTKGENRGLGLNNLKEIIRKYNYITLDTVIKNCEFVQSVEISNKY